MTAPGHRDADRGHRRGRAALVIALGVGVGHAVGVAAVVSALGYPVNALEHAPGGVAGAVGGLVVLAALPTFLALRYRLFLPAVGALAVGARAVSLEFATPPPTFSPLGGHTVVAGPRYVDAYVDAWYVWLFAALLLGAAEAVIRTERGWLPTRPPSDQVATLVNADRRSALRAALAVGAGHLAVFLLLAADWGYFAPGAYLPAPWYVGLGVLVWTLVGLVAVGGVAGFLLFRHRLVAPTLVLAWLASRTGWAQNMPLPDDPLPVYSLGWFVFAGLLLAVGGAEYGVRAVRRRVGRGPSAG